MDVLRKLEKLAELEIFALITSRASAIAAEDHVLKFHKPPPHVKVGIFRGICEVF
jgi:hypothetical protein